MLRALAPICCLDLDTFFVSVERLLDPNLMGKPVIVGASPGKRGVVTACSYEVRPLGVRSGMSSVQAAKLAPHAVFLPTRHKLYTPYAQRVRAVIERFTPDVQTASIDEFYLDFAGCEGLYHQPQDADPDAAILRVVASMRQAVQDEVGLPASCGVGASRAVAKVASRLAKPAGVYGVLPEQARATIGPMGVRAWPGIGPTAEGRLARAGVVTIDDLLDLPPGPHRAAFGSLSDRVRAALGPHRPARRGPSRPAFREHDVAGAVGSISNERTFMADEDDRATVDQQLRVLAERVAWRLRRRQLRARTITLKLRYANFETISRAHTLPPTDQERRILATVRKLLGRELGEDGQPRRRAVRLLGVALSNLVPRDTQVALPFATGSSQRDRDDRLARAVDRLRQRFGYDAIRLGTTTLPKPPAPAQSDPAQ